MSERNSSSGTFVLGFVVGVTAGAVAALLLTPRSGQETIGQIRARGRRLKQRAEEFGNQARQRVDAQIEQLQRLIQPHPDAQPAWEHPSEIDAEFRLDPTAAMDAAEAS